MNGHIINKIFENITILIHKRNNAYRKKSVFGVDFGLTSSSIHFFFFFENNIGQVITVYVKFFWPESDELDINDTLCGICPEKLAKKSKMCLKKFKKLSMQVDGQQNSALYSEFSRLSVEICRLETMSIVY